MFISLGAVEDVRAFDGVAVDDMNLGVFGQPLRQLTPLPHQVGHVGRFGFEPNVFFLLIVALLTRDLGKPP